MMLVADWVFPLLYFLAATGATALFFFWGKNRRGAFLWGLGTVVVVILIIALNILKEAPEKRQLISLAQDIRSLALRRRSEREALAQRGEPQAVTRFDIESLQQFANRFWTPVVHLRDKVARDYPKAVDHRLNFGANNLDDMLNIADGLSATAARLP